MIYPLAIATDGYLDQRDLLGIATRGYIWTRVGMELPHPEVVIRQPYWAEQPSVYTHFEKTPQVSAFFQNAKLLRIQWVPKVQVTADWLDEEIEGTA